MRVCAKVASVQLDRDQAYIINLILTVLYLIRFNFFLLKFFISLAQASSSTF